MGLQKAGEWLEMRAGTPEPEQDWEGGAAWTASDCLL